MIGGKLRYRIGGGDNPAGETGCVTEVSYDTTILPRHGEAIKYGNLFNEKYSEQSAHERAHFGPYLHDSDTAEQYDEGEIDPAGPGWNRNLDAQIDRAKAEGFHNIELDNPDAYHADAVLRAVARCWSAGLCVVAKNPLLVDGGNVSYLANPAIVGAIVERGAGTADGMQSLRIAAGKPILPIWFVAFDRSGLGHAGWRWINAKAAVIRGRHYRAMGATYSRGNEYGNCEDVLQPM